MLELNMMTKKAVAAADNVSVAAVPHRAYLHMYNTAYARRNVRQRAQLILQRVLCAFFFCFCFERERRVPLPQRHTEPLGHRGLWPSCCGWVIIEFS